MKMKKSGCGGSNLYYGGHYHVYRADSLLASGRFISY